MTVYYKHSARNALPRRWRRGKPRRWCKFMRRRRVL